MSSLASQNIPTPIELNTFLLSIGILFTLGSLITAIIITRQVMKSRWIDKISFIILCATWVTIICLIGAMWASYALYNSTYL